MGSPRVLGFGVLLCSSNNFEILIIFRSTWVDDWHLTFSSPCRCGSCEHEHRCRHVGVHMFLKISKNNRAILLSLSLFCIPGSPHLLLLFFLLTFPKKKRQSVAKHSKQLHPFKVFEAFEGFEALEAPPPHPSSGSGVPVNSQQTAGPPSAGSPDRSIPRSLPAPRCATSPGHCFGATPAGETAGNRWKRVPDGSGWLWQIIHCHTVHSWQFNL